MHGAKRGAGSGASGAYAQLTFEEKCLSAVFLRELTSIREADRKGYCGAQR